MFLGGVFIGLAAIAVVDRFTGHAVSNVLDTIRGPKPGVTV